MRGEGGRGGGVTSVADYGSKIFDSDKNRLYTLIGNGFYYNFRLFSQDQLILPVCRAGQGIFYK